MGLYKIFQNFIIILYHFSESDCTHDNCFLFKVPSELTEFRHFNPNVTETPQPGCQHTSAASGTRLLEPGLGAGLDTWDVGIWVVGWKRDRVGLGGHRNHAIHILCH